MENSSTVIHVVAVALIDERGAALMQQRAWHKAHGGLWEFPGGKVEAGESHKSAACREIEEELGVQIRTPDLVEVGIASQSPDETQGGKRHVIVLYKCHRWAGTPHCREDAAIAWVPIADIPALAMPPLDYPLARSLISSN